MSVFRGYEKEVCPEVFRSKGTMMMMMMMMVIRMNCLCEMIGQPKYFSCEALFPAEVIVEILQNSVTQ